MRKVNKDFDNPPAILVNAARCKKIKTALETQSAQHISNSDYSPEAVKAALEVLYNEKCSYCESTVKQVAALQVEHYRPKNGVLGDANHKGYYWLAVEWSNLVLGCPACNGQGAKGNKFPVAGIRVGTQNPFDANDQLQRAELYPNASLLADEQPLLIHPEIDDPAQHLKFDGFGLVKGTTKKGRETVKICDLNRGPLYEERQSIVNSFLDQCELILLIKKEFGVNITKDLIDKLIIGQLKLLKQHRDDIKKPYTVFVGYLLNNPSTCLYPSIGTLDADFKTDFKRAFAKFRKQELN